MLNNSLKNIFLPLMTAFMILITLYFKKWHFDLLIIIFFWTLKYFKFWKKKSESSKFSLKVYWEKCFLIKNFIIYITRIFYSIFIWHISEAKFNALIKLFTFFKKYLSWLILAENVGFNWISNIKVSFLGDL